MSTQPVMDANFRVAYETFISTNAFAEAKQLANLYVCETKVVRSQAYGRDLWQVLLPVAIAFNHYERPDLVGDLRILGLDGEADALQQEWTPDEE